MEHSSSVLIRKSVKEFVEGAPQGAGVSIRVEFLLKEEALV